MVAYQINKTTEDKQPQN